jgi:2,4-dienoyl-CoA reductase-like NADH-dependent reductase (Old Yellow Enzyme family)
MTTEQFAPLLSPFRLKSITLRNRFMVPSMQRWKCRDGRPTPQVADYYRRLAEGGFALVNSESCAVDHPSASKREGSLRMKGSTKEAWRACVQGVTGAGGHMLIQLWHEGAMSEEGSVASALSAFRDAPTLSPSGLVLANKSVGRAASLVELEEIKQAYVRSALMAQEIGAAGVELHAAHGFLLDQFLWAETNRRTDGYGGDELLNRLRFPQEIVVAIRAAAGKDFVISFRFSQWKELNYHTARILESPIELDTMLRVLREAGVDVFNVSTRRFYKPEWQGSDRSLASWTKALTDAAVITVGGVGVNNDVLESLVEGGQTQNDVIGSLRELIKRLNRGEFDLVAVGRASIADPDWVNKVIAQRYESIGVFDRNSLLTDMGWTADSGDVAWL